MFKQRIVIFLLVLCLFAAFTVPTAQANFTLGSVAKVYGIGMLVDHFSGSINNFINGLLGKHKWGTDFATKVVPIVSIGGGTYIGAVQVTGPWELVSQVKAVAQIEGNFQGNQFRIKALIPINTTNPFNAHRVQGVGVSAIIDIRV